MGKKSKDLNAVGGNNLAYVQDEEKGKASGATSQVASDAPDALPERGTWNSKAEYLLSMVGYAVGLGNVWRFPYLAYKNGGGAFLIPYTVMLAFAGLPLFFLECAYGQFASMGPITIWKSVPIVKGVGWTMVITSALVGIYYNCIIAYSLFYLFASFTSELPWAKCREWWGADGRCFEQCNITLANCSAVNNNESQSPSEQYWNKYALQRSPSMDETGPVVWHLALTLLLAWIIVGGALIKGIRSSGKVTYFTATFPYVVLLILLVRGVTLPGAMLGIEFLSGPSPDLSKLQSAEVWKDAATQIFFSLSTAWGGLIALTSYNKFHNNCFQDAWSSPSTNCATSVFAGFVIFSILGHMAHTTGRHVSQVADAGCGLLCPLFFLMLLTLGLDSQFTILETVTTALLDEFPKLFGKRRLQLLFSLCIILFLFGLTCTTQAGIYWVNLIDHFCSGWALLVAAILELIGINWIYGGNRFISDIEMMIGKKSFLFWLWWRACWFVISPLLLIAILVWSLVTFTAPSYGDVVYPDWAVALGWCMISFSLVWIPVIAAWKMARASGGPWERLKAICRSEPGWGPRLAEHRTGRYAPIGATTAPIYENYSTEPSDGVKKAASIGSASSSPAAAAASSPTKRSQDEDFTTAL
ncbi:LOW QUALITY PROTEIN: sodium- and chloride-dependent neutral and basic amino acid transporter B(0+)-like [Lampetra fluviatilis]